MERLRSQGLSVNLPRDPDRADAVVGHSVVLVSPEGEKRLRYGGGSLAYDLTLPRLRQRWATAEHTAQAG